MDENSLPPVDQTVKPTDVSKQNKFKKKIVTLIIMISMICIIIGTFLGVVIESSSIAKLRLITFNYSLILI